MKNNIKYLIKNWMNWDKKSILFFFIRVFSLVFQPIIIAYIPKAIIDCITTGTTIENLIFVIALLSVLLAITTWLDPFMNELLLGSGRIIRMRYAVMAFKKLLNIDYMNLESIEEREKAERAIEFFRSYYSSATEFIIIFNQIVICVIGSFTALVLICKINIFIVLIILLTSIIELLILKFLNKSEKKIIDERSKVYVKLNYFYSLSKNSSATKDLIMFDFSNCFTNSITKLISRLKDINSIYTHQSFKSGVTRALLNLVRELVSYIYLSYLVRQNILSISDFIFYFGIITGFSNWILNFIYCLSNLEHCCNDCDAFRKFIESTKPSENKPSINFNNIESIEFKNVSFSYPTTEENTIENMSFKITKGEKIAIVGENGAGKTTMIKLICGLYYPSEGDIFINGKNIKDFSIESYYDLFAAVFQDYTFLPLTIAENVCVTKNYDKKKLYEVFENVGLMDKINTLNDKENTFMVKEVNCKAVDFSGGENQKLLLAKALYKNAPILILDEPTAALDPISENNIYLKYNEFTNNKISFFVSHRLSSTRFCDRIFFIKDGKIVESGTHNELIKRKGYYYNMYQMQSYYYREKGEITK